MNCCIDAHTNSNDGVNNIRHEKESSRHFHSVTVDQIIYAVDKLKAGKADSCDDLLSDNFKNDTNMLYVYILFLFSIMLSHGTSLSGLLLSTMIPIPQNRRGNKSDSNNYRAICLSSLLGKLFDIIILKEQSDCLLTDNLQVKLLIELNIVNYFMFYIL